MRTAVIVVSVAAAFGLGWFVSRSRSPKAAVPSPCPEVRCPEASAPVAPPESLPPGTPLRSCLEQVARLDRNLRAAARCAPDGGAILSDNQAKALRALMTPHERGRLEEIIEAEVRAREDAAASARRAQGETIGAALADHAGLAAAEYDRVKALVCPLREAQERLRKQLAQSEIAPDDYFQLLAAQRGETERALETLLGAERYAKFRGAAGVSSFPCE